MHPGILHSYKLEDTYATVPYRFDTAWLIIEKTYAKDSPLPPKTYDELEEFAYIIKQVKELQEKVISTDIYSLQMTTKV